MSGFITDVLEALDWLHVGEPDKAAKLLLPLAGWNADLEAWDRHRRTLRRAQGLEEKPGGAIERGKSEAVRDELSEILRWLPTANATGLVRSHLRTVETKLAQLRKEA